MQESYNGFRNKPFSDVAPEGEADFCAAAAREVNFSVCHFVAAASEAKFRFSTFPSLAGMQQCCKEGFLVHERANFICNTVEKLSFATLLPFHGELKTSV